MVEAYVLIQTAIGKLAQVAGEATLMQQVATQAAGVEGVKAVAVVAGPYDLIARVAAGDLDSLAKMVVSRIQTIDGISRTLTCPVVRL